MLVIFGWGSKIAEEMRALMDVCPEGCRLESHDIRRATFGDYPLDAERFLFCSGYLVGKPLKDQTEDEMILTYKVNYHGIVEACDSILEANPRARICVVGSESGIAGSHDDWYAMCKGALHRYVEEKNLGPEQQLVCVAPGVIADAGMTLRRSDDGKAALARKVERHPKRRLLKSVEVARLVRFLLYEDEGYLSNTVIRMNGGEHTV